MVSVNELIDDRYRLTRVLGEGGMGAVYEANDIITNQKVAIKFLKPEVAKEEVNLIRFRREAKAMATLSHDNIVSVLNIGTYNELPYMVNELINGKTLDEELDTRTKFTFTEALDILDQLCLAVFIAHNNGVIHRDIKPSNIYITPHGVVKLGDFGIAISSRGKRITQNSSIVGTSHYLAPEICNGQAATAQSDIYALGITFFQLITGRLPFDGENNIAIAVKQIKEKFPRIKNYISNCPKTIEKIIYKCTQKKPKNRYRSVEELRKEIITLKVNPKLIKPRYSIWVKWFGFAKDE